MTSEKLEQQGSEYTEQVIGGENYIETAVAFANGRGGKILFYVERDAADGASLVARLNQLTQEIYDAIDSHIFPRIGVETQAGQPVLVVEILPGMEKPYYVKRKGMFDGTYVRSAGQTKLAEPYQVQELLLSGTNGTFDQMAVRDTIDEEGIRAFCDEMDRMRAVHVQEDVERKLSIDELLAWKLLICEGETYRKTNAWKLLEGTADTLFPEAFIQCAVYRGINRAEFVTGAEFDGSLSDQLEETMTYVNERLGETHIALMPTIRRLLVRAICQRSYLAPGRISLVCYDDRIELTIPALLEEDMTIWKLKAGFSKVRNRAITAAFSYMGLLGALSSALPELYRTAKQAGYIEPSIVALGEDVRINVYLEKDTVIGEPALIESPLTEEDIANEEAVYSEAERKEARQEPDVLMPTETMGEGMETTLALTAEETAVAGGALPPAVDMPAEDEAVMSAKETDIVAAEESDPKEKGQAKRKEKKAKRRDAAEPLPLALGDSKEERILALMEENPRITQTGMKEALGLSIATIKRVTAALMEQGFVKRVGSNRSGQWEIVAPKQ